MNDTSPEMDKLYRELLMRKSCVERLLMGFDLFDFARTLATRGAPADRETLFNRFYRLDFPPEERSRILERLKPG